MSALTPDAATICPHCHRELGALGRYCFHCGAYVADMLAPECLAAPKPAVPDGRSEAERKRDARPVVEALGWVVIDTEQGYRPDACPSCSARLPGGHSTRVRAGLADWIVIGHGLVVFVEWKSSPGRLTPPQRAFADLCSGAGVPHAVCRTTAEAVDFLRSVGR